MAHRFRFEAQRAGANYGIGALAPPAAGVEGVNAVPIAGLITGEDPGSGGVGDSVVRFIRELQNVAPLDAYTYTHHERPIWWRNVVDVEPRIDQDERGYYDLDQVTAFLHQAERVAQAQNLRWSALYTDFDAAKRINEALGERRVDFQWEHGPHPYVLHIHFYVVPI